jgi:peptidoglycan/xylan/chitin deacetylase (PgdA/CDA1 family)
MSKRELAARVLDNRVARFWSASGDRVKGVRVLAYHRVLDDDPRSFPFDEALISADVETFREQMAFVRSNFDVISFRDLLRCDQEGRPWPRRGLIVTFDDGYRDNYTAAFPVLKELGIAATIFLTTGHIGQKRLFWWDEVAYAIKHSGRGSVHCPEVASKPLSLDSPDARRAAINAVLKYVKEIPEEAKRAFLDRLRAELAAEPPAHLTEGMHLSWDDVRAMAAAGVEFGGHTVTHPVLSNVSREQMEREVAESKQAIKQNLGEEPIAFAYPVGRAARFNKAAEEAVARAGFAYAVSYDEGLALQHPSARYSLARIHVERDHSLSLFRTNVLFPRLMLRQGDSRIAPPAPAFPS